MQTPFVLLDIYPSFLLVAVRMYKRQHTLAVPMVSRSDLGMIRKSGKHSQISKYFRVPCIKTGEGEG